MRRALVLALLCAACGPGSYGDFRSQLEGAACEWAVRCGVAAAGETEACPIDTVLALLHDGAGDRDAMNAIDVQGDHAAGRLRYDSTNAGACLERVRGAPCDPVLAKSFRLLACSTVLAPNVFLGEACWSDIECVGGACGEAPGCSGTCSSYAAFGAACSDDAGTPTAMRCDPSVAWCSSTCQHKKGKGAKCTAERECDYGYVCPTGTCEDAKFLDAGAACSSDGVCKSGTFCDPGTSRCTKQAKRLASCTSALGCQDGLACVGLEAIAFGTAPTQLGTCGSWLPTGATCTASGVTGCAASDACTDGVCVRTQIVGGPGDRCSDAPCGPGLGCNASGACDYLVAIFGDCSGGRSMLCEPGLVCASEGEDLGVGAGRCAPSPEPACFAPRDASLDAGTD